MRHSEREARGSDLLVMARAHSSREVEQGRAYAHTGEGLKGNVNENEKKGGWGGFLIELFCS